MPQVKVDYIVSFSSEHPEHPSANLLSKEIANKRWIGLEKGEPSLSIVFQLEKSVQITSIHIGNYHSALIEVLVGRSESCNQQYEVLLCTSSFMTPGDARNSINVSNVRTFKTEQLVQSIQAQKWDRVRVVCTQPYNRHVQYGLSFIHFFSSDTIIDSEAQPSTSSQMLGKFKLRDDYDSDEDLKKIFKPGELFAKSKKTELSTEAQIRLAGSPNNLNNNPSLLVKTNRPKVEKVFKNTPEKSDDVSLSRKCNKIMYMDDDDDPHERIDKIIKKEREDKEKIFNEKRVKDVKIVKKKESQKEVVPKVMTGNWERVKNSDKCEANNSNTNNRKRAHSPQHTPTVKKVKSEDIVRGDTCLRGVVFVLSGYVNPKRSIIRDTAVKLGARYSADWNPSCTHLICAYLNTPKHNEVKASSNGGIIVTAEWIEDCGKEKAHLPWKWYATDPKLRTPKQPIDAPSSSSSQSNPMQDVKVKHDVPDEDDGDTDDDIERILQLQEKASKEDRVKNALKKLQVSDDNSDDDNAIIQSVLKKEKIDPYEADTESDPDLKKKSPHDDSYEKNLSDHFSGIKFYIDPNIADDGFKVDDVKRHVKAYLGEVIDEWPDKNLDVAFTTLNGIDRLKKDKNKKCNFLTPDWIWKCFETDSLYPYEEFMLR